jgi:2-polyprenyl-6-methoxyphenol hydroxylase-like FAD-dependent oxidoreductase
VLKSLGHHIRIVERTPTSLLHNQGAGIVFGGPAQDFFHKYDRTNSNLYVTSHTRQYLNKKGDIIDSEKSTQLMTSWDLLYNVLRRNFDGGGEDGYFQENELKKLQKEGDGKAEYLYGKRVTDITKSGDIVQVAFEDQDGESGSLTADLVFGADGPSSTIREIFEPKTERTNAGYVAWRGTVLESDVSEEARKIFSEKFTFFHRHGLQILA